MTELSPKTLWYFEHITGELVQASGLRQTLYDGQTAFQRVQILELGPFGRTLVLDGKTQSSESDEWVYHEALVQPAMTALDHVDRVFIAGGGEGATAREVLNHKGVKEVVMVDLDEEVVRLCKEYLPNHHRGSFDDPRLTLLHEDALAYLEGHTGSFDLVIIDVPDPLEGGPAYLLYTEEFYALVASRLRPGGLMVAQAGPAGPINVTEVFTAISSTLCSVFQQVAGYRAYMPSFGTTWGFLVAGLSGTPNPATMEPSEIDLRRAKNLAQPLRYYDGHTNAGLFSLPKYIRAAIRSETRTITKDRPLYTV